jgi:TRAP-type C4-dicarboxylate transport system permease small subunit
MALRHGWWDRIESGPVLTVATIFFLASTAIMLSEGFNRSVFDVSFFWAEESVRYLMIWAFFLTLGVAGRRGHHIRTELLVDAMPRRVRYAMHIVSVAAGVVFCVMLFAASLPQLTRYYTMGMVSESNLDIPTWIIFLAMPIGAALLFLYYLGCLVRALRGENPFTPHGITAADL